jgi:hypothetical protein
LKIVRNLDFHEAPDYEYLKGLLRKMGTEALEKKTLGGVDAATASCSMEIPSGMSDAERPPTAQAIYYDVDVQQSISGFKAEIWPTLGKEIAARKKRKIAARYKEGGSDTSEEALLFGEIEDFIRKLPELAFAILKGGTLDEVMGEVRRLVGKAKELVGSIQREASGVDEGKEGGKEAGN